MNVGGVGRRKRVLAGVGALVLLGAFGVTACSSDDSSNDSTAGASTTSLPANPANGAPVKIGFVSTEGGAAVSLPEMRQGAEAAVQYVNKNGGGLAGHQIDLVVCKQQEEPTSASKCANQFVENKVSAVLSPGTSMGAVILPIVAGAGIPFVTLNGVSTGELTSADSSSLSAGLPGSLTAMATAAKDQNMKSFAIFASDGGGISAIINQMGAPIFKGMGVDLNVIPIPLGTPDASPLVTSGLSAKPDGMSVIADAATCASVYKATLTTDPNVKKVFIPVCLDPAVTKVIGLDTIKGSTGITATDYLSDKPDSVLYRSVLETYAPDVNVTGAASSGYQVVMALTRATQNVKDDVTPAAVKEALKTSTNVEMPAGGGITFSCNGTAFPMMPSICSRQMLIGQLNDQAVPVDLKVTG